MAETNTVECSACERDVMVHNYDDEADNCIFCETQGYPR
jgi:hypothetical protein